LYGIGILGGSAGDPGSSGDPFVSKSYADQAMERRVQELDDKIISLEAKLRSLEDEVNVLSGGGVIDLTGPAVSGTGATPAASGGSGGAGSSGGSGSVSSANVGKSGSVTAEVVNLRESASTSSNIKKRLSPSDTFTITKVEKEWYQVQLSDGTVGWVAGYLVKIK
jgi:hypothetical protein